ncbi:MAG: CocE/NonD family hydrolase [Candidatus Aminicenantes bacterium]|nr:CocE/NonD family hydrolase [Candidatus Aminicenantes bacterium]
MTSPVRLFPCLLLLLPACSSPEPAGPSQPVHEIIDESKMPVPMRDGVNLAAHVYRPDAPGKFPTLMLLRYFRAPFQNEHAEYFAKRGYAVALVDSRGRYDSGGTWVPYVNEPRDGYDAQQWLGQQPWSNGEIGTMGISYNGFTQVMPAPLGSPYLKCLVPRENQQTNFGHLYNDGVMQLNVVFEFGLFTKQGAQTQKILPAEDPHSRRLPLMAAVDDFPQVQHVKDWFAHARYDEYWEAYGIKEKYGQIQVPAYFMTGWYDNLVHEGWRNFKGFTEEGGSEAARKGTKILVGPWVHGGTNSYPELLDVELRWYDYWLKGIQNGIDAEPPIKIFVMGPDVWRFENEWPLARTRFKKVYIRSSGKANGDQGDGALMSSPARDEPPDRYVYDPEDPVPTLGGQISTHGEIRGRKDRSSVQSRKDILVYTSEPLERDMEVTGPVDFKLYAASSAVDTDWTATLSDVQPDGQAIHVCEGIRGARFRDSLETPTLIEPGRVYEYDISLWETSYVFKAGHRIRLEISSSNFPRFARNQNIGEPLGTSDKIVVARQTVYHNAQYPSHLVLPVIPAGSGD